MDILDCLQNKRPMNPRRYYMLTSMVVLFGGCAETSSYVQPDTANSEVTDALVEAHIQEMVRDEHFSGVALVMQGDQIVHAKGYGAAASLQANKVDTAYHVASITKQFTAVAILQLVEDGEIELEGSINDYLPETYRSSRWGAVTVHHLLSHSSGIPDYAITRDYYEVVDGFVVGDTIYEMIKEAISTDLEFVPGSQYAYSNLGYALLGEMIEHQTGISFGEYVKSKILDPMSMTSSFIRAAGHVPATNEALGFRWSKEQTAYVPDDTETLPATAPDAGLITTLADFAKWVRIYSGVEQSILSNESVAAMMSKQIDIGRGGSVDAYGYGLGVGDRLIAHSGHVVGFRSQFVFDRQTGTLIAIFSNNSNVNIDRITYGLLPILFSRGSSKKGPDTISGSGH